MSVSGVKLPFREGNRKIYAGTASAIEPIKGFNHLAGGYLLLTHDVAAVLADRREHHAGHPVLKGFRLRLVGPHDQLVEAALGDQLHRQAPLTLYLMKGQILRPKRPRCVAHVCYGQGPTDISRDEPRVTVEFHQADGGGVESVAYHFFW